MAAIVWFIAMIMSEGVIFMAVSIVLAILGYVLWTWEFPQKPNTQGLAT
jgi:hypothetical protein